MTLKTVEITHQKLAENYCRYPYNDFYVNDCRSHAGQMKLVLKTKYSCQTFFHTPRTITTLCKCQMIALCNIIAINVC